MKGFNSVTLYFILLFAGTVAMFLIFITSVLFYRFVLPKIRTIYFDTTLGRSQNNSNFNVQSISKKQQAKKDDKAVKREMINVVKTSTGISSTDVEETMV